MFIEKAELEALLRATHSHPHKVLGMHPAALKGKKGVLVRVFIQDALSCQVIALEGKSERRYPLEKIDSAGFFEGFLEGREAVFRYRLRVKRENGESRQFYDPYSFLPSLGEQDLYLFNEGNEHRIYEKLGAHLRTLNHVQGVAFAVWAPSAKRVSTVGDFNRWDGRYHPMRPLGRSGIWEIFIPGLEPGWKYKYEILCSDGRLRLKTDPYGTRFEAPPHNASIIFELGGFPWGDEDWMENRKGKAWKREPVSIYEVHAGSWKRTGEYADRPLNYRELAVELGAYAKEMGFSHVEFLPLAEHPYEGSWGYQVTGFFSPTHRYGTPWDFMHLVDYLHRCGIGVIMDWVPGHFPADAFSLFEFDGTHLYEHADPRQGMHREWGTHIFNYGRNEVSGFLIASALAWLDRYHIDGLRVDAVASMLYLDYSREEGQWIPNRFGGRENIEAIEFLRKTNELVHRYYPGVMTIAEESTSWPGVTRPLGEGGLGFDLKWNMGWMHDTLEYFSKDPIHRKWHQNNLTFGMIYQFSESFVQVFSHDEVVHGKLSMIYKMAASSMSEKAQTLRALYALMWAWPGKKTLFMGSEFGQSSEWKYDSSLEWHLLEYLDHRGIQLMVKDLNALYGSAPAFFETDSDAKGFEWINLDDGDHSVLSFLRKGAKAEGAYLVVGHYTPFDLTGYRVGVPFPGYWREVINSNAAVYGGTDAGNLGGAQSEGVSWDGHPFSLNLTLPTHSTLILKYEGAFPKVRKQEDTASLSSKFPD